MTIQELLLVTTEILSDCETAVFNAVCLIEDFIDLPRGSVNEHKDMVVEQQRKNAVLQAAKQRAKGYPLQYLLGNWDFLNLNLYVGEGVLIPRPETELLCETVADRISRFPQKDRPVRVWDLCAGSGCVGLGISSLATTHALQVTEVELSDQAMVFLQKNIQQYPQFNVTAVKANVLTDSNRFDDGVDVIVSNPPYIKTRDLKGLQCEVQYEPELALNGDCDGLKFYRAIATQWIPKLRSGGFVAVEIGFDQGDEVSSIFNTAGLHHIQCVQDYAGLDRVVIGYK